MKHFLDIRQLSTQQITGLLERATAFKMGEVPFPIFSSYPLANLFYENSTRTRVSFELAASHLSIPVVNLDRAQSSEKKGEVIEDTLKNLAAMGIKLFIIRHSQDYLPQLLAEALEIENVHLINAGDGTNAHPSQAMLDLMTILQYKPDIRQCKIAIIGNIRHSRVANSLQILFQKVGVNKLSLIAPKLWQAKEIIFGKPTESLREGLADADVVICLRVQRERLQESESLDLATYRQQFALSAESIRWAKPDAIVMHPGPINRGVEIDSEVADGSQSVILQQVNNGVFMRMAIIDSLLR